MTRAFVLALLLLAPIGAPAHPRSPSTDECATDPSFRDFRETLLDAVKRKDRTRLLRLVADDVMVDFGGGQGRAQFARTWGLDRSTGSPVWRELREALRLGCTLDGGTAYAPAIFDQESSTMPEGTVVVTSKTALRAAPLATSRIVATLVSWDVLTHLDRAAAGAWLKVRTANGRTGYVHRDHVRSRFDYRAVFQRRDGRWRLTAFVAGD